MCHFSRVNGPPDTRIFSFLAGAGLYDTIGRYVYLFKRLTPVLASRFYRFEHIVSYSSGKVVGKVEHWTLKALLWSVLDGDVTHWSDPVRSRNPARLESLRRKNHYCVTEIPQEDNKRAKQQGDHSPSP